jgi:hypothetical protein
MASDYLVAKIFERVAGRDWVPRDEVVRDLMGFVPPGMALRFYQHERKHGTDQYRRRHAGREIPPKPRPRSLEQNIHSGQRRLIGSLISRGIRYGVMEQKVVEGRKMIRQVRPPRAVIGMWARDEGTFRFLTDEEAEALYLGS